MFASLSDRLQQTFKKLRGQSHLTEANMRDTLQEIRFILLEADVALLVVKALLEKIQQRALGQEVLISLNPSQALIKIVNEALIEFMGTTAEPINFKVEPPAVILLAGLQGSGKTTTAAKLARYIKERENKRVLLCSSDVYRPAAMDQLARLATDIHVDYYPATPNEKPLHIVQAALQQAQIQFYDVLIIDTAGRLHIDEVMMDEIKALHQTLNPIETLFVVDSMTGQDAVNTAKVFHDALPLTRLILTKTDGDARGGAALSLRYITGKPIKFYGTGEKTHALEPFYPERIVSRILGMGDVLSLIEEAERKVDKQKADKISKKIRKGGVFDFDDFRQQIQQIHQMGGVNSILDKMPGMIKNIPGIPQDKMMSDKTLARTVAMINSMTQQERRFPDLIKGSRKRRIALGSGNDIPEVNQLLKQFKQMQKTMKKMSAPGGMQKMMRMMQSKLPPHMLG